MLKIEVTAEDITNGEPDSCFDCPIALAMKRALPGARGVEVDDCTCWKTEEGRFEARMPEIAVNFMRRFDRGDEVYPLVFECEPVARKEDEGDDGGQDD